LTTHTYIYIYISFYIYFYIYIDIYIYLQPLPIKTVNKHQLTTMNLKPPIKHLPEAPSRESIVDIGVTDIFGHEIFFNQ